MSARRAAFSCNREISVLTVPSKREPDQPSKDKLLDKRRQAVPRGNRPSQQLKFHHLHRPLHLIPGQASAVQRHLAELVVIGIPAHLRVRGRQGGRQAGWPPSARGPGCRNSAPAAGPPPSAEQKSRRNSRTTASRRAGRRTGPSRGGLHGLAGPTGRSPTERARLRCGTGQ